MPGKYHLKFEDVPLQTPYLRIEERIIEMLLGQKYIGTAKKQLWGITPGKRIEVETYRKSELISLTRYQFRGRYTPMYCDVTDRIYIILDGYILNFRVGDEVYQKVTKHDVVFIPKGTPYCWDWAECDYMVFNGPAFQPGSDKPLDDDHPIPTLPY